jgi:2-keto-4-pentenoate hydratase
MTTTARQAAELLFQARKTGTKLPELPVALKPSSMDDVLAIITEMDALIPEPIAGYKFHKKPNMPRLCFAPLYASRLHRSPALIPIAIASTLALEAEICFRLTRDLPPRDRPYDSEEVFDAVEACVGFEVVDSRYRDLRRMVTDSLNEVFADHMANGAFVFGDWRKEWRTHDFAQTRVTMIQGTSFVADQIGGHPNTDPSAPLPAFVEYMRLTTGLKAGMPIATGSFTSWRPVKADEVVTVTFEGFGQAKATIVR